MNKETENKETENKEEFTITIIIENQSKKKQ